MNLDSDEPLYDVCVIGAGALGLFVTSRFAQAGLQTVLIEAGQSAPESVRQCGEGVHAGVTQGRASGLGGTTQLWGGQLWEWSRREFEQTLSGLENVLTYNELRQGYEKVREELGLGIGHRLVHKGHLDLYDPESSWTLRFSSWLRHRRRNFGRSIGKRIARAGNVTYYGELSARYLDFEQEKAIGVVATNSGDSTTIKAHYFVVAAGTVGSTALLLRSQLPQPLPWLGRSFMDHLSGRYAEISTDKPRSLITLLGARYSWGTRCTPRLVIERPAEEQMAFAHLEVELAPDSAPARLRRELSEAQKRGLSWRSSAGLVKAIAEILPTVLLSLPMGRQPVFKGARYFLRVDVEQVADPDSILQYECTGESGTLELAWSVSDEDVKTFKVCGELATAWLKSRVPNTVSLLESELKDTYHMMGTTRIGNSVTDGVVDGSLKVHGTANVYVVGPSTFPRGGLANPTMTAMAMANQMVRDIGKAQAGHQDEF